MFRAVAILGVVAGSGLPGDLIVCECGGRYGRLGSVAAGGRGVWRSLCMYRAYDVTSYTFLSRVSR